MNVTRNTDEMRFPNIYMLLKTIFIVLPLTIIIVLAIKAVGFLKVRQALTKYGSGQAVHNGYVSG